MTTTRPRGGQGTDESSGQGTSGNGADGASGVTGQRAGQAAGQGTGGDGAAGAGEAAGQGMRGDGADGASEAADQRVGSATGQRASEATGRRAGEAAGQGMRGDGADDAGGLARERRATAGPRAARPVRYRPRGLPRRLGTLLSASSFVAGQIALERDAGVRGDRLVAAVSDQLRQRLRPSRPKMRALIASGGGRLAWRDVPAPPPPGPDAAVVRPIAVANCDLDSAIVLGATPFPLPLSLGHECVAEVLDVGERVTGVVPGQRVSVPFQINCGRCVACRAGLTGNCTGVPPISMYGFGVGGGHWGGALADQVAVPYADAMLVPLPAGVDPVAAASVSDTICDGYRHVAPHLPGVLRRDPDAEVLIVAGLGRRPPFSASVPLYAGQVALALGARRVRLADSRADVRAAAERLGMEPLLPREVPKAPLAALVVVATASARGMWLALSRTAPDGVCSSAGGLHRVGRVPVVRAYGRNVSFHLGRTHARGLMPSVLELIASGRFRPERVISVLGALDDAPRLLGAHYRTGDIKTVLTR